MKSRDTCEIYSRGFNKNRIIFLIFLRVFSIVLGFLRDFSTIKSTS